MTRVDRQRAANVVSAFALNLGDRLAERSRLVVEHGAGAPAALVAASNYEELSIERLRHLLGLSHPGAVRLVDRLQAAGLVERRAADDGRAVNLRLTARGRRRVKRLFDERDTVVHDALAGLEPTERDTLVDLMGRLLDVALDESLEAEITCRLCSHVACRRTGGCPIAA